MNRDTRPRAIDVPHRGRIVERRLHVGAAPADDDDRQKGQQTRGDRKRTEDPEPQPGEGKDEDRNERAGPGDDRRSDHVGEPSRATAAVASRGSTRSFNRTTLSGSPAMPRSVR